MDLFESAGEERIQRNAPLPARMRPRTIDEVVGQAHLLGPGTAFRAMVERRRLVSLLLWGPPGSGKTTLARVIANATQSEFESLNAVLAGVKDIRAVVEKAGRNLQSLLFLLRTDLLQQGPYPLQR